MRAALEGRAGAEILVDRVRKVSAPKKVSTKEWLGVMREAHRLGISTTATMMYGHVETLEERVEHMRRIRELQDETGGFRAFFSWTFQDDGNRLVDLVPPESRPTSFDYLLTQAVSRIYLDNLPHIGSSWVTQGKKIGQVALGFRAGVPRSVAMKLTGHKTESVYRRYAIVAEADLREGVAKLARLARALAPPVVRLRVVAEAGQAGPCRAIGGFLRSVGRTESP